MLVIRRRPGESIVLPGGIEIQVLEIGSSRVKLGIIAPAGIPVARKERLIAGNQNQAAAASLFAGGLEAWACELRRAGGAGSPPKLLSE